MEDEDTILLDDADIMAAYNFSTGEDVEEKPEEVQLQNVANSEPTETINPNNIENAEVMAEVEPDSPDPVTVEEEGVVIDDAELMKAYNSIGTMNVSDEDVGDMSVEQQTEAGLGDTTIDPRIQDKYLKEEVDIIFSADNESANQLALLDAIEREKAEFKTGETDNISEIFKFDYKQIPDLDANIETQRQMMDMLTANKLESHDALSDDLQYLLNDTSNPLRAGSVNKLLNIESLSLSQVGFIVNSAEWMPIYGATLALIDLPENIRVAADLWSQEEYKAALFVGALTVGDVGISALTTIPVGKKVINETLKRVKKRKATVQKIRDNSEKSLKKKKAIAAQSVKANKELNNKMVKEFELSIDPTGETKLSKMVAGRLVLDTKKAREAGLSIAEDVYNLSSETMNAFAKAIRSGDEKLVRAAEEKYGMSANSVFSIGESGAEDFVSPLLKPESFNSVVAVAADLKKKFPKAFDNNNTVIDNLFKLTVSDKFDADELADTLAEFGLNFDQYVLTVVGSGSEAGKILNKLSQIKRAGQFKIDNVKTRELEKTQNSILAGWRRLENIRRGSMTSMLKTAMRNFQSAGIRAPLEALENVMDTTMLAMSKEFASKPDRLLLHRTFSSIGKGGQTLVSPSQWSGSLAALKRIYMTPAMSKDLTDIILENPKFAEQYTALFDNVNEYRKRTGAGSGGVGDKLLGAGESVVDVLSIPNRIQEYVIRRGVFTGELERLLKRDWGINMMDALEKGNLPDMIANAGVVRPKGAPAFEELIEMATKRALDVTYAKAPDVPLFKRTADFLTQNGLTAITTPFPRFMFNSIELIGQYSGGAFNPAMKRILGKKSGPLDAKDRQNISRNISGLVAITAAYQYRTSDGAPSDYKQMEGIDSITGENTVIDVTAQFPLRQAMWIAEAMKRLDPNVQKFLPVSGPLTALGAMDEGEGTFDDWFDLKEATETFLGVGIRSGAGNVFVDEIASLLSGGGADPTKIERGKKALGRLVGDYIRTHLIPVTQVVEIQRMVGTRPTEYADYSSDDPYTFTGQLRRSLDQSGVTSLFDPSKESELPSREFVLAEDRKRVGTGLGLMIGITVLQENNADAEYLVEKGFTEFELGSKEKGSIRREENALMRERLPEIVEFAREAEHFARKSYESHGDGYKKNTTLEQHINAEVIASISEQVKKIRKGIGKAKLINTDDATIEYRKYKRHSPSVRRAANLRYLQENDGEPPDTTDFNDLFDLNFHAEMIKKEGGN